MINVNYAFKNKKAKNQQNNSEYYACVPCSLLVRNTTPPCRLFLRLRDHEIQPDARLSHTQPRCDRRHLTSDVSVFIRARAACREELCVMYMYMSINQSIKPSKRHASTRKATSQRNHTSSKPPAVSHALAQFGDPRTNRSSSNS